jgi:hypothetical protein
MIRKLILSTVLAYAGTTCVIAQQPTFLSHPTLSPDGKEMVLATKVTFGKLEVKVVLQFG